MQMLLSASALCLSMLAASLPARAADSPYNKTFVGSANLCLNRNGQCTGEVPIHVYLAKSGRLYSFLRSEGGQMFSLGQFVAVGSAQQRFIVKGSTLVFEDITPVDGGQLIIHGYLRSQGGQCSVTGSATLNGMSEPSTTRGQCQVYDGQH